MNHGYEGSLVKRVVDQLVSSIVNGDYDDNALPAQVVLSKQHGVSRTIMREALSILISRRMLDVRPKRGTRIKPAGDWLMIDNEVVAWRLQAEPDLDFLRGLVEFWALVEPRAASLAATRATRRQRAGIRAAYEQLLRMGSAGDMYQAAAERLHMAIVEASGDELLQQIAGMVRTGLTTMNSVTHARRGTGDAGLEQYGQVVNAIEAGDAEGAKAAMTSLLASAASPGRGFGSFAITPPDPTAERHVIRG
jgi:DNA-binding FadR family transcriptional regulator